jgi:hypothetical protein
MADKETSLGPVDSPEVKQYQREQTFLRQNLNRGSRYPPFSIEPVRNERERVFMTDEQRALRRQWIKDQELAPDEPRFIAAIQPRNWFRRIYRAPLDTLESRYLIPALVRSTGLRNASKTRCVHLSLNIAFCTTLVIADDLFSFVCGRCER